MWRRRRRTCICPSIGSRPWRATGSRRIPLSGHLFAFFNRTADKVKILYWDRSGFCLWYKRLERGVFHLPRAGAPHFELEAAELLLLLDGIDLAAAARRPRYRIGARASR